MKIIINLLPLFIVPSFIAFVITWIITKISNHVEKTMDKTALAKAFLRFGMVIFGISFLSTVVLCLCTIGADGESVAPLFFLFAIPCIIAFLYNIFQFIYIKLL